MASSAPPADGIPGTLIYSKSSRRILLLEASKELVDLIFGILTLRLGHIIRLLAEGHGEQPALLETRAANAAADFDAKPLPAVLNLYASVQRLEVSRMCAAKSILLDPGPAYPWGGRLGLATVPEDAAPVGGIGAGGFFCCSGSSGPCEFIASAPDQKCPKHNKKMTLACKIIRQDNAAGLPAPLQPQTVKGKASGATANDGKRKGSALEIPDDSVSSEIGFVKPGMAYMITNSLEIFPSSSISSVFKLAPIKYQRIDDLASMEISVGSEEILQLLKASLSCSTSILNDAFVKFSNLFAIPQQHGEEQEKSSS